jgi:hypothetical protein
MVANFRQQLMASMATIPPGWRLGANVRLFTMSRWLAAKILWLNLDVRQ